MGSTISRPASRGASTSSTTTIADATANYNFDRRRPTCRASITQTGHSLRRASCSVRCNTSIGPSRRSTPTTTRTTIDSTCRTTTRSAPKLTFNLGIRWQILPGLYENNGYVTNPDLTLPNPAAGNRPGALRFADEEGRKTFIDPYHKQFQPRLGVAYAASPALAISGGYSVEQPSGDGVHGRRVRRPRLDRLQRHHLGHSRHAADAERAGSGHVPERALPGLPGKPSQPRLSHSNNQSVTVIVGDEAKREKYNNYNVTAAPAAAGELLDDRGLHRRATGRDFPCCLLDVLDMRQPDQPHPVRRARRSTAICCSATLSSQPQLGIPLPYPGFTGTVQQALRPYPQFAEHHAPEELPGQDALQLAPGDSRATFLATTSPCWRPIRWSKTRRQRPEAGRLGRRVGACRRPACPAFPQADVDL